MNEVFADTFYFVALANPDDRAHAAAVAASRDRSRTLITTAWVLLEVANTLAAPDHRPKFVRLFDALKMDKKTIMIQPEPVLFDAGIRLYRERSDKEWSLTDCISFVVMAERGIRVALTGDRHFEQAGFIAILK